MAGNIEELKRRLRSVSSIQKITRAMKLIATAKLQKARQNLRNVQDFYLSVYQVISELINHLTMLEIKRISTIKNNKTLYIVINSDLGFCGSYNNEIQKKLISEYNETTDAVITIGTKMALFANSKKLNVVENFNNIGAEVDFETAKRISTIAVSIRNTKKFANLKIIYMHYINSITFEPIILSLWPIDANILSSIKLSHGKPSVKGNYLFHSDQGKPHTVINFEPNIIDVFKATMPLYFSSIIFGCLLESNVSEQASRLAAMEGATDNAKELESDLLLRKNRLRQASITQEISEIISSVESKKKG